MSSSTDARDRRVVRGDSAAAATGLATPELRSGAWTRLGGDRVLGDQVTEQTLSSLAETTRQAAQSQGYAIGWAQGRREAAEAARLLAEETEQRRAAEDARREAEHRAAIAALEAATAAVQQTFADACAQVETQATNLAFEITRELVGRELRDGDAAGEQLVRRALAVLPETGFARLRVHPDLAPQLREVDGTATVVADPALAPGDILVEADHHVVDLRLSTALDRLREALA